MITLASTDTLRAIASAATQLTCTVWGLEIASGETYKILDQRQLPTSVTTIYTAPSAVNIRTIAVVNNDTVARTAQFYINGTSVNSNAITPTVTIEPGFCWMYEDGRGWRMFSTRNELQLLYQAAYRLPCFGPTSALAETYDRSWVAEVNVAALSTGRLTLQGIWLTAGMVLSSISFSSATTALATGTNQIFALYDVNRMLLAQTTNDTSTAWAANTVKTLNLMARYTVPYTGLYYLGIMVAATTVPTLRGHTAFTASQLHGLTPALNGTSSTGLTSALANPAAAITVGTTSVWGAVS